MFKEDLAFLPPASLPVGFPHASHSLPHSLPSLPFVPLLLQCSIHSSAVLVFLFCFVSLYHAGLQVGGDGGGGRGW